MHVTKDGLVIVSNCERQVEMVHVQNSEQL